MAGVVKARNGAARDERLLTVPFLAMCSVSFFSFGQNYVTYTILPLVVLALGGNAAFVGVVAAVFSVSSFAVRPFIGLLVDRWSLKGMLAIGTVILGVTGFAYAIPSIVALFVNRLAHGVGWAAVNTAGNATIAALAPPSRRGEAGGYYAMMPGLAQAVMPAIALAVLPLGGFPGAFAVAGVSGLVATLFIGPIKLPRVPAKRSDGGFWRSLLDPAAFPAMIIETLSSSALTLFVVFVPLYVREVGIPVESLGVYYAAIGVTIVVGRALFGRLSDRVGRGPVIALGGASAIGGVILLWTARDLSVLVLGGLGYALGTALVSPTTFALAADRTDSARRGTSFATYSMAFQLANGFGALLWGVLITLFSFGAAFAAAIVVQGAVVVMGLREVWRAQVDAQLGRGS